MRTEADTENPEGRDELKISGGIQTPRRKIEGSGARDTDNGGVAPRGPMVIVGCEGVKGMNETKGGCWEATRRIVGAWGSHSEHGGKEG